MNKIFSSKNGFFKLIIGSLIGFAFIWLSINGAKAAPSGTIILTDANNSTFSSSSLSDKNDKLIVSGEVTAEITTDATDVEYCILTGYENPQDTLNEWFVYDGPFTVSNNAVGVGVRLGNMYDEVTFISIYMEYLDKSSWGTEVYYNDIPHYVTTDGITSVEIKNNNIVWLKEESRGYSAWYGLDNSSNTFKSGSRFYAKWFNQNDGSETYNKHYKNLDDKHRSDIERLWIFEVGVINPDGSRQTDFNGEVPIYVQLGDDWDTDKLKAVFISSGTDEIVRVSHKSDFTYPIGNDEFAKLSLKHFSPYALFEKVTQDTTQVTDTTNETTQTTDSSSQTTTQTDIITKVTQKPLEQTVHTTTSTQTNQTTVSKSSNKNISPKTGDCGIISLIRLITSAL